MKTKIPHLILTSLFALASGTAQAVDYTWDPTGGDGQITDGTGNWNTSASNWTTDAGATNVVAPSSAFGSDLFFGGGTDGTAGTITLMDTGKEYGSLSFNSPNASSYDLDLNGNIVTIRRSAGTFKVRADATISDSSGGGELRHDTSQYRDYSTGSTLSVSAVVADRGTATVRTYDTITLDLSGVNTYTGNTEIYNSSTLRISGAGQLGSGTYAGTIAINNNGILDYNSSATQTLNGVISGSGSLVLNGTGQLNLSVGNSFTGGVTVNDGTLGLENGAIGANGPLTVNGGLVSGSIHDSFDNISVSELSGSGGLIEAARRTFTVTQATNTTYAGVIQDLNGIVSDGNGTVFTKTGSGTLTLTGDNTYSKTTNVNGGTLEVSGGLYSAGTNVGASSNINIGAAGTLDVTGAGSLGLNSDFDGTITNDGILNYNSSATQTLTGVISGSGSLVLNGSGQLNLSTNNGFTGGVTVNNGTLSLENGGIGANGPLTVNGGLVSVSIHDSYDNLIVSELSGSGGLIDVSRRRLTVDQAIDTTYAGIIQDVNGIISSGNGTAFTKSGIGTLTLSGDNTYSKNTTVSGGTLEVSGSLYSDGTVSASGVITSTITISAGTLDVTGSGSIGSGAAFDGTITNSGTFNYNSTTDQELSGIISGAGALTKDNSSTLTLTGANTYSGTTTVSGGTLALATGYTHTGTGAFIVEGGTLKVADDLDMTSSSMTIGLGGVISPGNSPGTAITGAQTWNDGGSYLWEINASDDAGGTIGTDPGWDWLSITGALDLTNLSAGGFTIDIDSLTASNLAGDAVGFDTWTKGNPGDVDYSFIIASASGGITDFSADKFSFDSSGFTNGPSWDWQIKLSGTDLVLEAYAVPEPSSTALLGLGGLALALRRRR